MTALVCVVEGDGDVAALPELLRRIVAGIIVASPEVEYPDIPYPIRIRRDSFLADGGHAYRSRYLSLARGRAGDEGCVLVLIDADEDCPANLANHLLPELTATCAPTRIAFVLAKREFETWFLAAAESIGGRRSLQNNLVAPVDPENEVANAKTWLRDRMPRGSTYSETIDQPALAGLFDWQVARERAPSLDKLCREVERLVG